MKLNVDVYLHLPSSTSFPIYEKIKKLEFGKGLFGSLQFGSLVVCGRLLVVYGRLLMVGGRFLVFVGGLWSFAGL